MIRVVLIAVSLVAVRKRNSDASQSSLYSRRAFLRSTSVVGDEIVIGSFRNADPCGLYASNQDVCVAKDAVSINLITRLPSHPDF